MTHSTTPTLNAPPGRPRTGIPTPVDWERISLDTANPAQNGADMIT